MKKVNETKQRNLHCDDEKSKTTSTQEPSKQHDPLEPTCKKLLSA